LNKSWKFPNNASIYLAEAFAIKRNLNLSGTRYRPLPSAIRGDQLSIALCIIDQHRQFVIVAVLIHSKLTRSLGNRCKFDTRTWIPCMSAGPKSINRNNASILLRRLIDSRLTRYPRNRHMDMDLMHCCWISHFRDHHLVMIKYNICKLLHCDASLFSG
jgi:hypothetical protein